MTTSYTVYKDSNGPTLDLLHALPKERTWPVPTARAFYSEQTGRCLNTVDGTPLYFDDGHLTNSGARRLAPLVVTAIRHALVAGKITGQ